MATTQEILPPKLTLGIDAMGGDQAPAAIVAGVAEAARLHPTVHFILFGDSDALAALVSAHPKIANQLQIRATTAVLPAGEKPTNALRKAYADASLTRTLQATKAGEVSACISAADTGAMLALGMQNLGVLDGIDRPAVASYMPTLKNETVVLDLGANLNVQAKHLHQFGILGSALAEAMLAIPAPRVGLLNIGTESSKGPSHIQQAHALMAAHPWPGSYQGFVEPQGMVQGQVDVLVCDGYSGNIMLKSTEAAATLIGAYIRASFQESLISRLGYALAGRQFAKLRRRTDPRRYNGAVMAGLKHVCIKSHGGADAVSFCNAIELAIDMVNMKYTQRVTELLRPVD